MSARFGMSCSEPWRRYLASQWAQPPRQSRHAAAPPFGAAASHFAAVSSLAPSRHKVHRTSGASAMPKPVEAPSEVVRGHRQRCLVATAKSANAGIPKDPARLGQAAKCWRKPSFLGRLPGNTRGGKITQTRLYLFASHTAAQPFGQADPRRLGPAPRPVVFSAPPGQTVGVRLPQTLGSRRRSRCQSTAE